MGLNDAAYAAMPCHSAGGAVNGCLALILRETRRDAHNLLPGRIALLSRQRDRLNSDPAAVAFYEYLIRMLGQIEIPGRVLGCAPKASVSDRAQETGATADQQANAEADAAMDHAAESRQAGKS